MFPGIKPLIVTCLPLVFLQACSSSHPATSSQQETPPAADRESLSADKPPAQPQTFMLRGQLVLSGDIQTITPCGSRHQYIARFRQHDLSQAAGVVPHPNQPVYAELVGHLEVPDNSGLEGDFPARFRVAGISMMDPEARAGCQQNVLATRAFGLSPAWSARFRENRLIYRIGNQTEQSSLLQSTRLEQHQRHYRLEKGKLLLRKQGCRPDSGSALYGWQSTFTLTDKTYRGCAALANLDPTQSWSGLYQATSTRSRNFSVRMQLHPDHTATTSYHYQDNNEASRESGFWQQVDRHHIQVVMTRYQGQRLIAERVFSGDRYRMTATTETVNGTTYPIKDGGLTLFRTQAEQQQSQAGITPETRIPAAQALASSAERQPAVEQALRHYFQLHRTPVGDTRYRWLTFDLNHDGKEELLTLTSWCREQGCTMLVFEQRGEQWRFNSRISGVQTPFYLGTRQQTGWQELILPQGRGAQPKALPYSGVSYPARAEDGEAISSRRISKVTLFRDGLSPQTDGVKL